MFLQLTASVTKQFILGENYWQQIKLIQMSPCLSWFFPAGVYGFHSFSLRCNLPSTTVKSCETQINKKLQQNEMPALINAVDGD